MFECVIYENKIKNDQNNFFEMRLGQFIVKKSSISEHFNIGLF